MTSRHRPRRSVRATLAIATAAVTLSAVALAGSAGAAPGQTASAMYLVQLADAPIAAYTGGVSGIAATKPALGAKLDPRAWNYGAYRDYLRAKRTEVLATAKIDKKKTVAEYDTVVNGVAAKLTGAEVAKLRATAGVVRVWKNEVLKLDTISTPRFLGLDGPNGAWARQFGDVSHAGEGTIIGVIDSGIWPESPSFAALPEPRPDADVIAAKWFGVCEPGDDASEDPVTCNNKLIGARAYDFGSVPVIDDEFHNARDFDGHGTHTASTAAGNNNVPAVINGVEVGRASGMAPAARVAAYKICYELADGSTANCGAIEAVAAVDDAVADGVDVINYSIGGSTGTITDLLHQAWFNAAAAGVFVSTSAGNSGPAPSTVAFNSPWTTTVAASTHDRQFNKSVTLGNGQTFTGAGVGPAVPSSPLIDSVNAGLAGADPAEVELCFIGTLDPAKVTGKIVLCARGVNARVDKSQAVRDAGGVGMVLYNPTPNSLNADFHFVPTVHVGPTEGAAIKAYIAGTASPTASIAAAVAIQARAPQMAAFSSVGPGLSGSADLLKPDITAPGVDVIAAVSPVSNAGNLYNALSGTSMSSPHVAGIGLLLKSKNPTWSPMAIKSAIMTTATTLDNTGQPIQRAGVNATPFDFGAGHVRPGAAFDPGLVYESTPLDWFRYTCGIGEHQVLGDGSDVCAILGEIDPSDLNYPSIAVGDLAGKQTVTRTVTNTTRQASVYVPVVQAPAGYSVKVSPAVMTVLPNRSASYTVEITRTTAAAGQWSFGSLTWADLRGHSVRSPLVVRAAAIAATAEVATIGASGAQALTVRTNFNGTLTAKPYGLVAPTVSRQSVDGVNIAFDPGAPAADPGTGHFTVTVPAGTKVARFATFTADHQLGTELDLYVYKDGNLVGQAPGAWADRAVTVTEPGTYEIFIPRFTLPGPQTQDVVLNTFLVPATPVGNFTATPASQPVTAGKAVSVNAAWTGLTPGTRYFGLVEYGNGPTALDRTYFSILA
jgi:hypothetical protein